MLEFPPWVFFPFSPCNFLLPSFIIVLIMLSVVLGNFQVLGIRQSIWGMIRILHECIHTLHELRIMIQKGWGLNTAPPKNLPNSIQGPSRDAQITASTEEIK